MKIQVTLTRTEDGVTTKVKSETTDSSKDDVSWRDALSDAEQHGMITAIEEKEAYLLPPGFPRRTNAEIGAGVLDGATFTLGKTSPRQ